MALVRALATPQPAGLDALRHVAEQARPLALAGERILPVLPTLEGLLPEAGLRRGSTVEVDGAAGAGTLALALGAAATAAGSWAAAVGMASLGLLAAAELGMVLDRLVVVPCPPPAAWARVVATLAGAVDLVYARPPRVAGGDARRLVARVRERGAVLVVVPTRPWDRGAGPGGWPLSPDVALTVASSSWSGVASQGAGRLAARRVEVLAGGRGSAAHPRRVALWLPGPDGAVASDAGGERGAS